MNSFFEHHKDSIRWRYRCFDRILLNGLIQPVEMYHLATKPSKVPGQGLMTPWGLNLDMIYLVNDVKVQFEVARIPTSFGQMP